MAHPLDGSRAKVARAGDHLEVLDAALTRFVKDGGFTVVTEHDTETHEYVFRINSNLKPPVPPPTSISAMVGDVLNNLRSALDYIIWQLAAAPSKKNQFPIFSTPEGFKDRRDRYLLSVPEAYWTKIESYQPYPGREANKELGRLALLNDVDKHRLLLPGAMVLAGNRGRFTVRGLESITIKGWDWVPFEDGAEIYRMKIVGAGGPVQVQAETPHTVVFGNPSTGLAASIQDLRNIRIVVYNVVESFANDFPPAHDGPPIGAAPSKGGSPSPPSNSPDSSPPEPSEPPASE